MEIVPTAQEARIGPVEACQKAEGSRWTTPGDRRVGA